MRMTRLHGRYRLTFCAPQRRLGVEAGSFLLAICARSKMERQQPVIIGLAASTDRGFMLAMASKAVGTDDKITNYRMRPCGGLDRRRGCGLCDHLAARNRRDRTARAAGVRCRPRPAWPRLGCDRQLQRLSHRARG